MTYVYRHIRLDKNEPFYIGIGTDTNYQRAYSKHSRNIFWQRVVKKTNYDVEIIMDNLTKDKAKLKEIELITLYGKKINNTGTLVNITDGGESGSGYKHTEESKRKIAEANKYKDYSKIDKSYMQTKEYKDKVSKNNTGRIMPKSMREKTSLRMKGQVFSIEHKEKLKIANTGLKRSDETKEKMRLAAYIGWQKRKNKNI